MKYFISIACLFVIPLSLISQSHRPVLKIPFETRQGYGPFRPSFKVVVWENPNPAGYWSKTKNPIYGVPPELSNCKKYQIWFDARQFAYQHYRKGNISRSRFKDLAKSWSIDTTILTQQFIRCTAYMISGQTKNGDTVFLLDTDNDQDFSDESYFIPQKRDDTLYDELSKGAVTVEHDIYINGKVSVVQTPVLVLKDPKYYLVNFPFYAYARLDEDEEKIEIAVNSSSFGLSDFSDCELIYISSDSLWEKKAGSNMLVKEGEYFRTGKNMYLFHGVNPHTREILLEKFPLKQTVYSSQEGFYAQPFEGYSYTDSSLHKLADYRGKYVYLDFWATFCMPCIKEFPELRKVYNEFSGENFIMLGIVEADRPGILDIVIDKKGVVWPQIMSDQSNSLIQHYNINSFPTTFLLDPTGKIIARDLRAEGLRKKLKTLLKESSR